MNHTTIKTQILIARHGNTFKSGEIPTRVGARTDLPLVETAKANAIGHYLIQENFLPDIVYASPLKRTSETAKIALETAGLDTNLIQFDEMFREIDYGPDENKTEDEVIARIGQAPIDAWNQSAIVPPGWLADPKAITSCWQKFGKMVEHQLAGKKVLVVTSNGVARFSAILCGDTPSFQKNLDSSGLKISTGALCLFEKESGSEENIPHPIHSTPHWRCVFWNKKPNA